MDTIQSTIFDAFKGENLFTVQQAVSAVANNNLHCKRPSVRARIYEGVDLGLFEKITRGVYKVTAGEATCLCVLGDGRDLSMFDDESVDAIITDHPYDMAGSLNGGNRHFAEYDRFQYTEADFKEKARVLKPGAFLCEFLPEESEVNYEYLYEIKQMAKSAGFQFYTKVPWKKGSFVANTGRKSKNTEDIVFFTKGKARSLKPDAKKNLSEPGISHYMSGTNGMLPTVFDVQPPSKNERIHQAEKPAELLVEVLQYITLPGELVLDQFAGSGNLGVAALEMDRDCVLIENDEETYHKMTANVKKVC